MLRCDHKISINLIKSLLLRVVSNEYLNVIHAVAKVFDSLIIYLALHGLVSLLPELLGHRLRVLSQPSCEAVAAYALLVEWHARVS
jgi:hypothetical protein